MSATKETAKRLNVYYCSTSQFLVVYDLLHQCTLTNTHSTVLFGLHYTLFACSIIYRKLLPCDLSVIQSQHCIFVNNLIHEIASRQHSW